MDKKSLRPVLVFTLISLLAAGLSAPKLLPVLELLHNHPRPTGVGVSVPWDVFSYFFIDRFTGLERSLNGTGWWAFGSYLGAIVIALYLFSFTLFRKHVALVLATLLIFLISLGNFGAFSPWSILHGLPLFSGFQIPTRALIVFCFGVALLSGYSLAQLGKKNNSSSRVVLSLTVLIILCDLFSVSAPTLSNAVKTLTTPFWENLRAEQKINGPKLYRIPPSSSSGLLQTVPSVHQPFTQISIPFAERNVHGAWSDQYLPLLQNRGVIDAYETIPFERYINANTDDAYVGEYYLAKEGAVSLKKWSPNKLLFHVKSENKNRLIINQNFNHGWRSSLGHTTSHKGLLAVDLSSGDYGLEVYYSPKSFSVGVYVLIITIGSILLIALGQRIAIRKT